MLLVISPSKTQNLACRTTSNWTGPEMLEQSLALVALLRKYDGPGLERLMKISPKLGQLNLKRFAGFTTPFTLENARQALFFFTGDLYTSLAADSFNAAELDFAQGHLRILSGLYGALRPLDLLQPYRLEMGTRLANERGKNLYHFWGSLITDQLRAQMAASGSRVLVNLASDEYFKAVKTRELGAELLKVSFKEKKDDGYRVVAIHAKRARGLMVNYIIRNQLIDVDDLKGFARHGYRFNKGLSSGAEWVFTRDTAP
ncbi:MAG: peroxide stress protein YaaA [Thermodesulfobacteriota bacterium]